MADRRFHKPGGRGFESRLRYQFHPKRKFKQKAPPVETKYRPEGTERYKSKIDEHMATHDPVNKQPLKYEDADMAQREAEAQAHKEWLAKTSAPAYNKGLYQPVTSEEQAKWIGRK